MNGTNFVTNPMGQSPDPGNTPSPDMIASQQLLCMNSILAVAAASSSVFKPPPRTPPNSGGPMPRPYSHPYGFNPYGPYGASEFGPKLFPRLASHVPPEMPPHHPVIHHSHRFGVDDPKPAHSYIGLIAKAILSTPERKMVLADIYQHILDNYSYFRNRGPGWRNSIRHNLSLNDCFMKSGRSANGKGHYWAIHPANLEDFIKGDFRRRKAQRKVRRHMGLSVPDDDDDDDDESPLSSPNPIVPNMPHPLGMMNMSPVNTNPIIPGPLPDPATALLLSNPQLLAMSGPLFGQLNLFNSLRSHLPSNPGQQALPQLPPPPPPPPSSQPLTTQISPSSLSNPLFNEHLYKQLINLNLKHQHLQSMVEQRNKLDSPPSIKKEFSIESLLRPTIAEQSRTPSPSARKTPTSDYDGDITPVNLKIFP